MVDEWKRLLRRRVGIAVAVLAPPLASLLLIKAAAPAPSDTGVSAGFLLPAAPAVAPKHDARPFCVRVAPSSFVLPPGTAQELSAVFWGDAGELHFAWSADGGNFGAVGQPATSATLDGYIGGDNFESGALDPKLWKASVPEGATLVEEGGVLAVTLPAGKPGASRVVLESLLDLSDSFSVEVTVTDMQAGGMSGATALAFHTEDGFEEEVRRVHHNAVQSLQARGSRQQQAVRAMSVFDPGGVAKLRMQRVGSSVEYGAELGGTAMPIGVRANPTSAAKARAQLSVSALETLPTVRAAFDGFMVTRNVSATWRAPSDAAPNTLYTIRVADGCQATARIAMP